MPTFATNLFTTMKPYPDNNIARKENGTGICHVMQGKESKTCPRNHFIVIYTMGKSYHTKKKYRQRIDEIDQSRKKQSDESDITVLSTLNQMYNGYGKASESLSRHPSGTKASGLRKRLKGEYRISDKRDRFGEAEEQSSRLRKERRRVNHSVRLNAKKDLRTMMNDLGDDKEE